MVVCPAPADHGIVFIRNDLEVGDNYIAARWDMVEQSPLCTRLVNEAGVSVSTVEHIMAALAGCGIHNALIEIDGPEVPIMDGSSVPFVLEFLRAGTVSQMVPIKAIEILKPVSVETEHARAELRPNATPHMTFSIDFADAAIGKQTRDMNLSNGAFVRVLCDSRTFCRNSDVEFMRANGLALGGTLENAVVVDGDKVLSPGGFRHIDEAVRHKMLDALGDLYLAGAPIIGHYIGTKAGHSLTNSLLRKLFATEGAFRVVACDDDMADLLPGAGVRLDEYVMVA